MFVLLMLSDEPFHLPASFNINLGFDVDMFLFMNRILNLFSKNLLLVFTFYILVVARLDKPLRIEI